MPTIPDLSIHLAKVVVETPEGAFRDFSSLKEHPLDFDGVQEAALFVKKGRPNPPRWAAYFEGLVQAKEFGMNSSGGAVL